MEGERKQNDTTCRGGCGFFGSSATNGLCSLCYKQQLAKMNAAPPSTTSTATNTQSSQVVQQLTSSLITPKVDDVVKLNDDVRPKEISNEMEHLSTTDDPSTTTTTSPSSMGLKKEGTEPNDLQIVPNPLSTTTPNSTSLASAPSATCTNTLTTNSTSSTGGSEDKKPKTNRCLTCRKKVGLLGFECRCGGLFCGTHRYSDKHECSFNYRELGAQEIRKNNPVVVSEKIKKL